MFSFHVVTAESCYIVQTICSNILTTDMGICILKYLNTFFKVFVLKYFPKVFDFFKYIVCINIPVSITHLMPAKRITFTATSPKSANY